jgi:hypothetical protein
VYLFVIQFFTSRALSTTPPQGMADGLLCSGEAPMELEAAEGMNDGKKRRYKFDHYVLHIHCGGVRVADPVIPAVAALHRHTLAERR